MLVSLGVKFGSHCCIFGQRESKELGILSCSVPIPPNEWIKDIVLHLSNLDLLLQQPAMETSIKALSVGHSPNGPEA
jgi:hypothetical protein